MRTRPFLAAVAAFGTVACGSETTGVDPSARELVVQVAAPGGAAFDAVQATLTGADSLTAVLVPSGDGQFAATVRDLPAGEYAIWVVGRVAGEATYAGTVPSFRLAASGRQTVTVPFPSFVPALADLASPTTSTLLTLTFPPVAAADSYRVEIARAADFTGARQVAVAGPGAAVVLADSGVHHVRVRAVARVAGVGQAGAARTLRLTTDLTASGGDPASAADLGFAAGANGVYGGLNVLPAGDQDWFRVRLCRDDFLRARLVAPAAGLRARIRVYDAAGALVNESETTGSAPDVEARAFVPDPGVYLIQVAAVDTSVGSYDLGVQVDAGPETGASDCLPTELLLTDRLDAGMVHSCGVAPDGTAWCWGDNAFGQLGDGTTQGRGDPVAVGGGARFRTISAGWEHTCGVTESHEAFCWGRNDDGRLGDGAPQPRRGQPGPVAGSLRFRSVSAGVAHTCGVTFAGELYCWGANGDGQLGNGSTTPSAVPVKVTSTQTFVSVSAGFRQTCAVTTVAALFCWGGDEHGQVGNGPGQGSTPIPQRVDGGRAIRQVSAGFEHTCAIGTDGRAYCWGFNRIGQVGDGTSYNKLVSPQEVPTALRFRQIAVAFGADTTGGAHTCGLVSGGDVYCWGFNLTGQLGTPTTGICDKQDVIDVKRFPCSTTPVRVQGGIPFASVSAGLTHTCGVATDGTGYCWGDNQVGQSAEGAAPTTTPTPVATALSFVELHPSGFHTCAVAADSTAYCWGANAFGQLGNGTTQRQPTPTAVSGGIRFATFTAGLDHTCGTDASGAAYCWGKGTSGQLGIGTMSSALAPTSVAGGIAFRRVEAGDLHTCGLAADSSAYCWGHGGEGRTGTGKPDVALAPDAVAGGHQFVTIATGNIHACAAKPSGALYCWGYNSDGQIGNDAGASNDFSPVPDSVHTTQRFDVVSTGFYHTCGVTSTGTLYCWGDNDSGQLGNGTISPFEKRPVPVASGLTFQSVSVGFYHTCGLTTAGQIYCWGDNLWGQLGNGETTDRSAPVLVSGGLTFQSVVSGDNHTCGITTTGESYCWGRNCRGQLGIGRDGMSYAPLPVTGGLTFRPAGP